MLALVSSVLRHRARQHQIDYAFLTIDPGHGAVDRGVLADEFAVLPQNLGKRLIVNREAELLTEQPGVVIRKDTVELAALLELRLVLGVEQESL